jgi:hypothetical protein
MSVTLNSFRIFECVSSPTGRLLPEKNKLSHNGGYLNGLQRRYGHFMTSDFHTIANTDLTNACRFAHSFTAPFFITMSADDLDAEAAEAEKWRADCIQIVPGIFISGWSVASDWSTLTRNGITHSVNCISKVHTSLPNLVSLNLPIVDGGDENILSHVWATTAFISDALASGHNVLVHCIEGRSRSVSVVIAYFILTRRLDFESAFSIVRERRTIAFPNPQFTAQLKQLAEVVGASPERTCFFAKERILPFEIVIRRGIPVALPLDARPEMDANRSFVILELSGESTVAVHIAANAGSQVSAHARNLAAQLTMFLGNASREGE